MRKFKLKDKKILIYGAGSVGKVISDAFVKAEIEIAGYIDKRADYIRENDEKPVYGLSEAKDWIKNKDKYAVIISIRNVFEHSSLAETFSAMGYKNIIYKPITILRGRKGEVFESINYAYEKITGSFTIPDCEVACFEKESVDICDYGLQEEMEDDVIVKLPAELLFSNTNNKIPVWSCQNFYSDYIAVDLYEAFGNAHKENFLDVVDRYIDRFALPGAKVMGVNTEGDWREILIDSRQKVYYEMEYNLSMEYDFFSKNCTKVDLKKDYGFELIASGKNRVSFLIAKGFRYIPVRINKGSYTRFLNLSIVNNISAYLQNNSVEIFAPIPHPYFYRINVCSPGYAVECVRPIARFLAEQVYMENEAYCFGKYSLAVALNDEGYMGRFFKMLGYGVHRIIAKNLPLCMLLDELFCFSSSAFEQSENLRFYCSIISDEMQEDDIRKLISHTDRFFVALLSDKSPDNKFSENSNIFKLNRKIFETIWDGKRIYGYVYERISEEEL